MRVLTFHDFRFRARHKLDARSPAAGCYHWHAYRVRLKFAEEHDQDWLTEWTEKKFHGFHGVDLASFIADSTDENIARFFLEMTRALGCIHVEVENDGRRGAEASL